MEPLQRVGQEPVRHLLRSDAERVARALRDRALGEAMLSTGVTRGVRFVRIERQRHYSVVIHAQDWLKIAPFVRYGSEALAGVRTRPVSAEPTEVPSFQRALLVEQPQQNPGPGLTTFMEALAFADYRQVADLLPLAKPYSNDDYSWLVSVLQQLFPNDYPTGD